MAIRKSRDESFEVTWSKDSTLDKCVAALSKGGFKSIQVNKAISQISADYHKLTVWGKIEVTVKEKDAGTSIVETHTTANIDNIYALFVSPIDKIANAFKNSL